jgi:hypothetical protein
LQALRAWEGVLGDVSTSTVVGLCTHALSRLDNNNNNNKKKKQSQLLFRGLYCKHCPACRLNFNRPNKTYKCWLAIAIEEDSLPSRLTGGGAAGVLEEIRPHLPSQPHRHRDGDVVDGDGNGGDDGGYVVDPFESYISLPDHIDDDDEDEYEDEDEGEESLRRWLPWLLWKYKSHDSTTAAIAYDDGDSDGDRDDESDASAAAAAAGKKRKTKKQDAGRKKAKVIHGPSNKRAVREKAAQLAELFQVPIDEITIWTCWKPKQQEEGRQSTSSTTTTSSACGHINGENLYECEVCGGNRWDGPIGQLATRVEAIISSSRYTNKNGSSSKQLPLPSAEQIAARMQWEANTTVDDNTGGVFPVYYGDPLLGLGRDTLVEAIDVLLQSRQFQSNNNNNNDGGVVVASQDERDDDSLPLGMLKIMPRTLLGRSVVRLESTVAMMVEDLQALHKISSSSSLGDDNRRGAVISSAEIAEQRQRQEEEEVMVNVQEPRAENIQPSSTLSHFVSECVGLFHQLGMHQALQEEELSFIIQSLILVHHQLKPNLDVRTFIACLKVLLTDNKRKWGIESDNVAAAAADGLTLQGLSISTVASALVAIHNSQLEAHPRQGELTSVMTRTEWKQDNHHHHQHHLKTGSDNNDNVIDDAFLTAARSIQTLETFLWNLLNTILKETSSSSSPHTQLYVGKQKGGGKVKKRPNASGPDEIEHPPFLGLPPYPATVTTTGLIGGGEGGRGSNMGRGGHTLLHAPMAVEEPLRSLKKKRRREEEGRGGGSTSVHQERAIALEEKLKDLPNDVGIVFNAAASLGVRDDILKEALDRWKHLTQ